MAKKKTDDQKDVSNNAEEVKEAPKKKTTAKKNSTKAKDEAVKEEVKEEVAKETKKTAKKTATTKKKAESSKKTAKKKTTKKKEDVKVEEAVKEEPVVKEEVEDKTSERTEVAPEVVEEPKVEETAVEETTNNEEIPSFVSNEGNKEEKVEVSSTSNNTYTYTQPEKKKKKHIGLIIFLVIVALLAAGVYAGIRMLDNTSKLAEHFDDVEAYKSQITITDEQKDQSKEELLLGQIAGTLQIDEQSNATVSITKPMIYNYIDIEGINNLDIIKNNPVVINKVGYDIDTENSIINLYSDVTYKNFLKIGVAAKLKYELTETGIIITYQDCKVGDLPTFFYQSKLPKAGTVLYSQEFGEVELLDGISVRLLAPNMIKDIAYTDDGTLNISINAEELAQRILEDLNTEDADGNTKMIKLINAYIKEYLGYDIDVSVFSGLINSLIGTIDFSKLDLNTLFNLLG